jgi:uncharacterized secreted protein with C-terminal beta-propeller domain
MKSNNNGENNRTNAKAHTKRKTFFKNIASNFIIVSVLVFMLILSGCSTITNTTNLGPNNQNSDPLNPSSTLNIPTTLQFIDNINTKDFTAKNFESEKQLTDFLSSSSYSGYGNYYRGGIMMEKGMASDAIAVSAPTANAGSSPTDFSQTNNQLESVDEADLIKTDGKYIYTLSGNSAYILKSFPAEDTEVISTIDFNSTPESLFISGKYLAVFGNENFNYPISAKMSSMYIPYSNNQMSFFKIYDVSDKTTPELVKEYRFEGNYFNARMKDNFVYFITTTYSGGITPYPMYYNDGIAVKMPLDRIFYYPMPYQNPMLENIFSIDLSNPAEKPNTLSVTVEGNQNMYMSDSNIYIASTEYVDEYQLRQEISMNLFKDKLSETDKALIDKINAVDSDVLSFAEKKNKIYQVYEKAIGLLNEKDQTDFQDSVDLALKTKLDSFEAREYTVINKIAVSGKDIELKNNVKIPGHVLNQFSMDEYNNVLRVATTVSSYWSSFSQESTTSYSNVYTLNKDMEVIDSLKNLGKTEQIYSTRFVGDRLYVVTFRQVDPFFVIDLSNSKDIKSLGELKVPGFSRYLHPYSDNMIIGIGQDASDTGRIKGLKISLFDVTDVSNPKEVAKYVNDDKYMMSEVFYEHKAFLFSKEKNLLVIPAYNYDYNNNANNYNGALVFNITEKSITLRGLIDHSKGNNDGYYYQPSVQRSLYIDSNLYTKSESLIRINALADLKSVKNVSLTPLITKIKVY